MPLLPILRSSWSAGAYRRAYRQREGDDADDHNVQFNPSDLTAVLCDGMFNVYSHMVLGVFNALQTLSSWFEGCACHEHILRHRSGYLSGKALGREIGIPGSDCPMKGKRAAEAAAGAIAVVFRSSGRSCAPSCLHSLRKKGSRITAVVSCNPISSAAAHICNSGSKSSSLSGTSSHGSWQGWAMPMWRLLAEWLPSASKHTMSMMATTQSTCTTRRPLCCCSMGALSGTRSADNSHKHLPHPIHTSFSLTAATFPHPVLASPRHPIPVIPSPPSPYLLHCYLVCLSSLHPAPPPARLPWGRPPATPPARPTPLGLPNRMLRLIPSSRAEAWDVSSSWMFRS